MKKLFTTIGATALFVWSAFNSNAQGNSKQSLQNNEMCGSAIQHNRLLQSDPAYKARFLANEQKIQEIINQQKLNKLGTPNAPQATVYNIPVVVHVIHLGEAVGSGTNISDAQIQSAINNLTTAYRNQSPYNGIDVEVQFALAQRDPNCNATTGINRVNGAGTSDYSTNGITSNGGTGTQNEITIKALSKWSNSTYYNIWVVAGIDGNMGGGGVQGYAYFPGAGSNLDGAVMLYNAFGYDPTGTLGYNLKNYTNHNGTAIHEMGHAFNLYHTFEGDDANSDGTPDQCPTGNQCGSGIGDCCNDVPPHQRSMSTCNPGGTNACDGGSSNALFVHNWMDYSSDACKDQFTSDQKTRMRAAIIASRGSLVNSLAGTAPSGSMPTAACIPVVQNAGSYAIGVYEFIFNGLDVPSGTTYADGGYVDRACYYQSTATAGSAITVTVNTGATYSHNTKIYIDYNNDGDFLDAGEQVFSTSNLTGNHTGTITLSASPPLTNTLLRMRVYADYFTSTITSACMNPAYGQAEDYGITITPAGGSPPVANFSGSPTTLCVGSSVTFTDASTNSPTSWSWVFQGGNPATSSSQNPVITYTAAGTYSVSLQATNGSGNNTMTKLSYITVNAKPTVTASATSNPICSGSSTTLNGGGAVSYVWTGGVTNGVAFAPGSTATYTVTGTDVNSCTNTNTITVTVNATPTVNVAGTLTITSGSTTTLTASGGTTYIWTPATGLSATTGAVVTANPTVTTSYTVTGTTGSCSGSKTFTVTVNSAVGPTNLLPAYCGITEGSLNQYLYCAAVANSTNYSYELTDQSNGSIIYYTRGNGTDVQLVYATGVTYARTYAIRVRAYVSGAWTAYGTSCNVTTPTAPTTQLQPAYCGITEATLNQVLYCNAIPGASSYRYELTDISNGSVTTYTRLGNSNDFQMVWNTAVAYGKTYSIRVAAQVGGVWLAYGSSCNVTTPATATTQLQPASCGITLATFTQPVYCSYVSGATSYGYELTDISNGSIYTYVRNGNSNDLQMDWVTGATYAKTYSIRVRAWVGSSWTAYGSSCNVTTPAAPTTKLSAGSCNIVEATFAQTLWCDAVTGATNYGYEVTDQGNGSVYYYTRGNSRDFAMNWVTGVTTSKAYNVRVRSYVGSWLPYGPVCSVTTAASIMANPGDVTLNEPGSAARAITEAGGLSLNVFPNPNDGHVYLQVSSDAKVVVTNLLGEKVYEGTVKEGTNELYFLDTKPGMYIIRVSDGVNAAQVRIIKE